MQPSDDTVHVAALGSKVGINGLGAGELESHRG